MAKKKTTITANKEPAAPKKKEATQQRIVRCPVCGGSGEEYKKTGDLTVCMCQDCSLLFQNPRPALGHMAAKRNALFKDAMLKPHGKEIKEQTEIATVIMKGYHKLTSGRPAALNAFGKNVLDVNCAHGFRLREFQRYGWDINGIDASKDAVEYSKACALDVKEAWLDTAGFMKNTFELIVFQDTFSDVPDPKRAVGKLHEILKPKGVIYVHSTFYNEEEFDEKSLFYFDEDSLRRLFMSNGFNVVEEDKDEAGFSFWIAKKGGA